MKLFNPDFNRNSPPTLIGGDTSNVMILNDNKYSWTAPLYKAMVQNYWVPEEVSLNNDAAQYKLLSDTEKASFDKIISFLVFLDSLQTIALPNISDYVTLPEVKLLLSVQTYQEAIHSQSYSYVLESVVSAEKRRHIYDIAIEDPHLRKRNEYIANIYQKFVDEPNDRNFARILMADFLLEGIYFYSGFAFFYNLARLGKMTGVGVEIKYINRDENTHLHLFTQLLKELQKERPDLFTVYDIEEFRQMTKTAVENEVAWAEYAFATTTQGLHVEVMDKYIKYIANARLRAINFEPLYPEVKNNPIPFITRMSSFNGTKTDFFEEKPINYAKASADLKLDDLDEMDL